MKRSRRHDESNGYQQNDQAEHLERLRRSWQTFERRLEHVPKLKAEQDLSSQHEHPALIERKIYSLFQFGHTAWSAIRMPSNCGLSLAKRAMNLLRRCDFTALDVRLPYDKWKARLISIRDRLTTQEGRELLEANHGKLRKSF